MGNTSRTHVLLLEASQCRIDGVDGGGSDPSGSQTWSNRETAALGTIIHTVPTRAQLTAILCSDEKPSMPMNSRPLRSRINPRHVLSSRVRNR